MFFRSLHGTSVRVQTKRLDVAKHTMTIACVHTSMLVVKIPTEDRVRVEYQGGKRLGFKA